MVEPSLELGQRPVVDQVMCLPASQPGGDGRKGICVTLGAFCWGCDRLRLTNNTCILFRFGGWGLRQKQNRNQDWLSSSCKTSKDAAYNHCKLIVSSQGLHDQSRVFKSSAWSLLNQRIHIYIIAGKNQRLVDSKGCEGPEMSRFLKSDLPGPVHPLVLGLSSMNLFLDEFISSSISPSINCSCFLYIFSLEAFPAFMAMSFQAKSLHYYNTHDGWVSVRCQNTDSCIYLSGLHITEAIENK